MKVNNVNNEIINRKQKAVIRGVHLQDFFQAAQIAGASEIDCVAEQISNMVKVVFTTKDANHRNGSHTVIVGPRGKVVARTTNRPY